MNTILGFTPYWDYKPTTAFVADSPGVFTSEKISYSRKIHKTHLKCDVIDGSVVNGIRQPIFNNFVLNNLPGYKLFCEPEIIHYKQLNKSVLNTITFFLKDYGHKEVDFNGKTLTFTLQSMKIETIK